MPQYGITSGLPALPVAGDKEFALLYPIYTALNGLARQVAELSGKVSYSQAELTQRNPVASVVSQAQNRIFVKALEDLSFGQLVNLTVDSGNLSAQLADATDLTKPAAGLVAETAGIATGSWGEVTLMVGHSYGIAGTTVGAMYWLSTGGLVQNVPPAVPGNLIQGVGVGLGSAGFFLNISPQLQQA